MNIFEILVVWLLFCGVIGLIYVGRTIANALDGLKYTLDEISDRLEEKEDE